MYTFVKKGQTVVLQLGVYYFNNCWLYFTVYICLNHNLLLNKQLTQGRLTHFITFHLMTLFTNYIHLRHESIMFPHDDLILVMPLSYFTVYICLNHNLLLNKQLTQGRLTHFITFHLMTLFTNYIHLRHESIMFPHDDLILVMPLSLYHLSCSGFLGGVIAVCSIPFLHHLFTCFI